MYSPQVVMIGVSHKSAPLEVREALALAPDEVTALMTEAGTIFHEGMFLSTCNRAELYAVVDDPTSACGLLAATLVSYSARPLECLEKYIVVRRGTDAIEHLFDVAAGLDSMVLGEDQILGQVKRAYEAGMANGTVGLVLSQLARQAISLGKRARSGTQLGKEYASLGYRAVMVGEQSLGGLEGKAVLVVGAGKMGRMVAKALHQRGVSGLAFTNRTFEKAQELVDRFGGYAVSWEELGDAVAEADLVISCTGSSDFVITHDLVATAMEGRPGRPLVILDIAVPRDIDPRAGCVPEVSLYDVDYLGSPEGAKEGSDLAEVAKVRTLVLSEVTEFQKWQSERAAVPLIRALRDRAEAIRQTEVEKSLRRSGINGAQERQVVEAMSYAIVNKLLHPFLVGLKNYDIDPSLQKALRGLVETSASNRRH
ncbi:MAG: glutamyl-tRNA reductase [Dehalococcoidia bacterium]|nr:glutamyl-tRNA reductase [Dehalococcoidia bacterium]